MDGIEGGLAKLPKLDRAEVGERNGVASGIRRRFGAAVNSRIGDWIHGGVRVWRTVDDDGLNHFRDGLISVAEFDFEREYALRTDTGHHAIDLERWVGGKDTGGTREDVVEVGGRDDAERNLPIDAPEGEVVNGAAEGRDVGAFGGVELNDEYIFGVDAEMGCEFKGEGCEASLVFTERNAVDPDGRGRHGAFEIDEDALAAGRCRIFESTTVGGDELILFVVEAVPWQLHICVGNDDFFKCRVVERW